MKRSSRYLRGWFEYMKFKLVESLSDFKLNKEADLYTNLSKLMKFMDKNISYKLANDEYGEENDPPTKSAEEVLKTKSGHCAEQSYLEKKLLDEIGIKTQLIFIKENSSKKDYGADGSAHMLLAIKDDKKWIWFEHSMNHAKGIHIFSSIEELVKAVSYLWWRYTNKSDLLEFRFIDKPITGINNWELAQECYKAPIKYITDISFNVMEKKVAESIIKE